LRRFQIGFVWRLFRFLVLLSGNVRIRLCHRLAAVACCAATQAHLVLVIRPASAIRHLASAIRHPPSATRQSGGPRRTNGPTAGSRNPRRTKHHWDSLTTGHWQLATIFSPLATRRVKALTHRAPPFRFGGARACFSHRNVKDHPHYPNILSLRQNYPSLASVSGTCSPFDGMSSIATRPLPPDARRPFRRL